MRRSITRREGWLPPPFSLRSTAAAAAAMRFAPPSNKLHTTQEALKELSSVRMAAPAFQIVRSFCRLGLHLFECGRYAGECRIQTGTQGRDRGDDRNRDTGGDKAIFNGGCSLLIIAERLKYSPHGAPFLVQSCRNNALRSPLLFSIKFVPTLGNDSPAEIDSPLTMKVTAG
jgi:hypothetical protein